MHDEQLKNLLQRADSEVNLPWVGSGELARRVRALVRQRRRRRATTVCLAMLLVVGGSTAWLYRPLLLPLDEVVDRPGEQAATGDSEVVDQRLDVAAEFARLGAEADYRQYLARRMIALEKRDRALAQLRRDALQKTRRQVDVVAFRMILRAERMRATMQPPAEAIVIYEEVLQLFPTTDSAEVARLRLAEITP